MSRVNLCGDTDCCRWERELCLECQSFGGVLNQETIKSFPQTVEKEDCKSGL